MKRGRWEFREMELGKGKELAISEAMLTSLKSRGLLTGEQVRECLERLERIYCRDGNTYERR